MMFKRNARGPLPPLEDALTVPVVLGECFDQYGDIMYWTASAWTDRPIMVRYEYKWDALREMDAQLAADGYWRDGRIIK